MSSYKGYVSSYYVDILNSFNHELQLNYTESTIRNKLIDLYTKLRGFKFVTTSVIEFKKYKVMMQQNIFFNYNLKAETIINESGIIINESHIDDVFESMYTTIISNIRK